MRANTARAAAMHTAATDTPTALRAPATRQHAPECKKAYDLIKSGRIERVPEGTDESDVKNIDLYVSRAQMIRDVEQEMKSSVKRQLEEAQTHKEFLLLKNDS